VASRRLADALSKLAESSQATRDKTQATFVSPMKVVFEQVKKLAAGPTRQPEDAARRSREFLEGQGRSDARRGTAAR